MIERMSPAMDADRLSAMTFGRYHYATDDGQRKGRVYALDIEAARRCAAKSLRFPISRVIVILSQR